MANQEFPKDAEDVLRAAGTDIYSRLAASGHSYSDVKRDLNQARSLTQENVKTFRNFFAPSIAKAVERLDAMAKEAREDARGPNRPNGQVLAELCTLVLATGEQWPEGASWDICSKAVIDSIYPDPDGTLTLEVAKVRDQLAEAPLMKRMCVFHRYRRAERLAEKLRQPRERGYVGLGFGGFDLWDGQQLLPFLGGR